jgi:hypothetical protein
MEIDMDTTEDIEAMNVQTTELTIGELDAVAGGKTLIGSFVSGFLAYAPEAGLRSITRAQSGCL